MITRKTAWKKIRLEGKAIEALELKFLTGLFEAAMPGSQDPLPILVALGELYTKQGLYERGLEIDRRLVEAKPEEPTFHYNLACSHSLLGQLDTAFEALERAIHLGYDQFDYMRTDPDLGKLWGDERYAERLRGLSVKRAKS